METSYLRRVQPYRSARLRPFPPLDVVRQQRDTGIDFVFKHHIVHGEERFQVPTKIANALTHEERVQTLWWTNRFDVRERIQIGEQVVALACGDGTGRPGDRTRTRGVPPDPLRGKRWSNAGT